MKFTEENGMICLTVREISSSQTGAKLFFSVRDNGISISSRLVQLMESDIVLESEPGEESEFSFTLQMEFAREKKEEQEDCREMPIIAMSANAFAEDIINSRISGMDEHLTKPLEPARLVNVLKDCIWRRKHKL